MGPTFKGLWGSKVDLTDGTTQTVDENYIEEMIESPGRKVVKGFNPIMPKLPVTHEEIEKIIDYLKALK